MSNFALTNPFYRMLDARISDLGGMSNAHLHLDRAGTLDDSYLEGSGHRILERSYVSLLEKHSLIKDLHAGPAYQKPNLERRVNAFVDVLVGCNTSKADTLVDVTADGVGLSALETLLEIKRARHSEIELRVGAYSPLGFTDDEPERWEVFARGTYFSGTTAMLACT